MRERELVGELMDDPALPESQLFHALQGLNRLNMVSLASLSMGTMLSRFAQAQRTPLRVLDVACADGAWAHAAASGSARAGMQIEVSGCDINAKAIAAAQSRSTRMQHSSFAPRFFVHDMIQGAPPGEYDIVIASLFMHHLSNAQARGVLLHMKHAARVAVVVNDLERRTRSLTAVACASRVLSRSRIVHVDAVRSVRAAFTRSEMLALFASAGMPDAKATWGGLSRMMVCASMPSTARAPIASDQT